MWYCWPPSSGANSFISCSSIFLAAKIQLAGLYVELPYPCLKENGFLIFVKRHHPFCIRSQNSGEQLWVCSRLFSTYPTVIFHSTWLIREWFTFFFLHFSVLAAWWQLHILVQAEANSTWNTLMCWTSLLHNLHFSLRTRPTFSHLPLASNTIAQ